MFQVFERFQKGVSARTGEPEFGEFAVSGEHTQEVAEQLAAFFNKTGAHEAEFFVREV